VVDIADIVTYTNFGDRRLRGFWVAGGQISPSPIDFHRRPYNTLVISKKRQRRILRLRPAVAPPECRTFPLPRFDAPGQIPSCNKLHIGHSPHVAK